MRVSLIRAEMETALKQAGFGAGSFDWLDGPNTLIVAVGGKIKKLKLPGKATSRAKFNLAVGRVAGWADMMVSA